MARTKTAIARHAAELAAQHADEPLKTEDEAAQILGMASNTLAVWRCTGRVHIPYVRVGRSIRYKTSDLQRFIEANRVEA